MFSVLKKIKQKCTGGLQLQDPQIKLNDDAVRFYSIGNMPLPRRIDIETVNRCNGICPFCPVNANQPQRQYAKMSDELFKKIIQDLEKIDYTGSIALFDNNEPFLDERICDFQKYGKEHLPNAFWDLWTNGSLLTIEKLNEIIPYLDRLFIDNYNDDGKLNPPIKAIADYIEDKPELKAKVVISMRLQNEILTSRGGQAPNKKQTAKSINARCVLPFQQLNIRPDGKISLCCNDALGVVTLGDCNKQTIEEIWYSNAYQSVREKMKNYGRDSLDLCSRCDTLGGDFSEGLLFERE